MMKRLLTILMTVLLLFSSVLTTKAVFAEEEYTGEENTNYSELLEYEETDESSETEKAVEEEPSLAEEIPDDSEAEEKSDSEDEEKTVPEEIIEEVSDEGHDDPDSFDFDDDLKDDSKIYTMDDVILNDDPRLNYHKDETDTSVFILSEGTEETFDLPEQYDLRDYDDVTSIKNQGSYGTCWAHATLGSAESSYLKKYGKELDLSEAHLAYFTYHNIGTPDKLSLITNDGMSSHYEESRGLLQGGGNTWMASFMMASGIGPISESEMPYTSLPSSGNVSSSFFTSYENNGYCYRQNDYYIDNVKWFSINDPQAVKNAIMNYGAVTVSYFAVTGGVQLQDGTVYLEKDFLNYDTGAYYNYAIEGTNHAVLIVGWDDNYDKNNFVRTPDNDGAWLIKNSWGTWYGNDGYFWISYEDVGLLSSDTVCQVNIEPTNGEIFEYQYAGASPSSGWGYYDEAYIGNIYYAQGDEILKKVSYITDSPDTKCTIEVYTNVGSNPKSGFLAASKTVTETYAGIHTVDLDEIVRLTSGQKFSVIVHQEHSGLFYVRVTDDVDFWYVIQDETAPGQSYISSDGSCWRDLYDSDCTAMVMAYTYAAPSEDLFYINYHDPLHAENNNPVSYIAGSYDGMLELYDLEEEGYTFQGWYTDTEFENQITSIDTNEPQDYDLYAKWEAIRYSIYYELSGGQNSEKNPDYYTIESEFTLEAATKEYYDFDGWYLYDDERIEQIEKGSYGDLYLYAHFVPHNYPITYELDGGTVYGNPDFYNVETDDISLKQPYKRGYLFIGWTGTDLYELTSDVVIYRGSTGERHYIAHYVADPNTQYLVNHFRQNIDGSYPDEPFEWEVFSTETGSIVYPEVKMYEGFTSPDVKETTVEADGFTTVDYYYTRNSYSLTINKGNGIREVVHKNEYKYEEEVELETILEAGYENEQFSGDFDVPVFTMPAYDSYIEVSAEPIWYYIFYDLGGGVLDEENPYYYTVESEDIQLVRPFKEFYKFIGWTGTDLEVPTLDPVIVSGSLGDRYYTANFVPLEYEISYELDGGKTERENPVSYNIESDDIILFNPSKKGHRFIGWTGTDLEEETMEVIIRNGSTGDREYNANYEICDYTITYVLNDSEEQPAHHDNPDGFTYGDEIELSDAVRDGYRFEGWYLNKELTQRITVVDSEFDYDLTVYASWVPISYTIIFDFNGLKEEKETLSCSFGEEYELPVSDNINYRIYGWSYESDGEIAFEEGTVLSNLTLEDGDVITLYAIWDYKYQVSKPYIYPELDEEVEKGTAVFLFCDTENAEIRYTLDGRDPDRNSLLYEDPIIVEEDTYIKAIAYAQGFKESEIAIFEFYISCESEYGTILPEDTYTYDELGQPEGLWLSEFDYYDMQDDKGDVYFTYTGKPITLSFRVYYGNTLLKEGSDYSVKYTNNTKAALSDSAKAPSVVITGKGNYIGTLTRTFNIMSKTIDDYNTIILANKDCFTYNKKVQKPTINSVVCDSIKLNKNTDYEVIYHTPDSCEVSSEPSDYFLEIKGKGNYESSLYYTYSIVDAGKYTSVSVLKVSGLKTYKYGDDSIEEDLEKLLVKDGNKELVQGIHYEISNILNGDHPGTAYLVINGIYDETGGYVGELLVPFKITALALNAKMCSIELGIDEFQYQDEPLTPEPVVYYEDTLLEEGRDYSVSYKNNNKAGIATITIEGKGGYSGKLNKTFRINKVNMNAGYNETKVEMGESYAYEKGGIKPLPVLTVNGRTLVCNTDYTLAYKNNTFINDNGNPAKITSVTIKGKGNYEGTIVKDFEITEKSLSEVALDVPDKAYTGKPNTWKSNVVLTDTNGKKLAANTNYDKNISYTYKYDTVVLDGSSKEKIKPEVFRHEGDPVLNTDILNTNAVITVTVAGKGSYKGTKIGHYRIVKSDISKASVTIPVQYYTGKPVTLNKSQLTVRMGKEQLSRSDFDIISYQNNIAKGTAKVTIKGKGNYGGTKTVNFTIKQRSFGLTIHFDGNGATSGNMNDQIIYANNVVLTKSAFKRIDPVTKQNVAFLGWNTKPNGKGDWFETKYTDYSIFKAGRVITLYAMWEGLDSDTSNEGKVLNFWCWNSETFEFLKKYYADSVVDDNTLKKGDVLIKRTVVSSESGNYLNALDEALVRQKSAPADEKIDIFLAEYDYISKYVDSDLTLDIRNIEVTDFSDAYGYTVDAVKDAKGAIKGIARDSEPSVLIYRRSIALDVLGTDDPAEVQAALSSWDKFDAVTALAKEKGYYMIATPMDTYRLYAQNTSAPWVVNGKLRIDSSIEAWMDQSLNYVANGYTAYPAASIWSSEKTDEMYASGKTMCFFGPAWYYNYCMGPAWDEENGSFGDWAICEGPAATFWGGVWMMAASGTDNPTMVAEIMNMFINNEEVCSRLISEEGQLSNNRKVNRSYANDPSYSHGMLSGQNDYIVQDQVAADIRLAKSTTYDQQLNELFQSIFSECLSGEVSRQEAIEYFKEYVRYRFPELIVE